MSKITLPAADISLAEFRNRDHCISYEFLQKLLRLHMNEIDKILHAYYAANDIFPAKDDAQIFKWNIMRKKNTSQVEVFFSERYDTDKKDQEKVSKNSQKLKAKKVPAPMNAAGTAPTNGQPGSGSGGDVANPEVLTYSLVGAPPSGPSIPKP